MTRKTLRDQLRESAKSATAIGAEHRAIVEALEDNAKKYGAQKAGDLDPRKDPSGQKQLSRSSFSAEPLSSPSDHEKHERVEQIDQQNETNAPPLTGNPQSMPEGQPDQAEQVSQKDQDKRPQEVTESNDLVTWDTQLTRSFDQAKRQSQLTQPHNPFTPVPSKLPTKEIADSPGQKAVLRYLQINGDHVTTHTVISRETGIPLKTVQRALDKFVAHGILEKKPWRVGRQNGLRVCLTWPVDSVIRPSQLTRSNDQVNWKSQATTSNSSLKIDRLKNLSISFETMQSTWPALARTGFGLKQIEQIERMLAEQGKSTDRVIQGLDHLEYELAHDQLRDKAGQPVSDPCSWAFRALAQNGYYRRPKGYISPEEQAVRDAEEEAKAVTAARQAAEQAQFEVWRDGLSPDDLADALRGHPGGPKDAWLKKTWRDRRN